MQHDVRVIEVRTEKGTVWMCVYQSWCVCDVFLGYGARWTHDGAEFRGFVEPQMADGHLLGWRH